MSDLTLGFELDRAYSADDIGHFRAFCYMQLKEPKYEIFEVLFGSSDKSNRMRDRSDADFAPQESGIKYGIGGGQWERNIDFEATEDESEQLEYKPLGWSTSIGIDPVKFITITYVHDRFIRLLPRLSLSDIDESSYMPMLNKSLSEKIKAIHIYSNGYKLQEIAEGDFSIDTESFDSEFPVQFTEDELADPWVRVRPVISSAFRISFAEQTPQRLFSTNQTPNSLASRARRETDED